MTCPKSQINNYHPLKQILFLKILVQISTGVQDQNAKLIQHCMSFTRNAC